MKSRRPTTAVTSETTVNEVIRRVPGAVRVLGEAGIDACCGGALPLAEAARRHGLELEDVLADLDRIAEDR